MKEITYLSSPHIRTIRERITLGTSGEPVSAKSLSLHFHKIKEDLNMAVELEKGHLSHFEVCLLVGFVLLLTHTTMVYFW